MKQIKQVLGGELRKYTMVIALVALILIFHIASGGKMITPSNFQNLLSGNAYVLILAIGMLMVIVIGQIDLSVGSVSGFCGMVMALTATNLHWPWWAAVRRSISRCCAPNSRKPPRPRKTTATSSRTMTSRTATGTRMMTARPGTRRTMTERRRTNEVYQQPL